MKLTAFISALILALSLASCKNEPKAQEQESQSENLTIGKIRYSLKADGRMWKVASQETQDQLKMTQYILEEEQPENISELFTVTEMTDVNITPAEYFSQFITELQKRYTNVKVESTIINQKTHSLLGEWWIDGQSPDNTQHEWIRIIKKGNDIAVLRYSSKDLDHLAQRRRIWESILNEAKFQ